MDYRAAPRRGFAIHFPAPQRHSFAHPKQSEAYALLLSRHYFKADPIVPHHQMQGLRRPMQFEAHGPTYDTKTSRIHPGPGHRGRSEHAQEVYTRYVCVLAH
jgi:hypothetical protein